jgi:hypothetical protein
MSSNIIQRMDNSCCKPPSASPVHEVLNILERSVATLEKQYEGTRDKLSLILPEQLPTDKGCDKVPVATCPGTSQLAKSIIQASGRIDVISQKLSDLCREVEV